MMKELDAEKALAFDNPAIVPFIPLMAGGNTERMLHKCADRIRREPRSLELETILSVFASYVLDSELIKRILRWEMQVIKESPILQEAFTEQFEQGEHKATLESLYRILNIRFQVSKASFDQLKLEEFDLETLKKLNEIALTVADLGAFEEAVSQLEG